MRSVADLEIRDKASHACILSSVVSRRLFVLVIMLIVVAGGLNATLMYDDPFQIDYFSMLSAQSVGKALTSLFFNFDLGGREYRLYGMSRILHFGLWQFFGSHAWAYGAFMAASQVVAALGIHHLLCRLKVDPFQALMVAVVWVFSPFAINTVFHHYSYLILPYQLIIACALCLQRLHDSPQSTVDLWLWRGAAALLGITIAYTGESHLPAAVLILLLVSFGTPSLRSRRSRFVDFTMPVMTIIAAVVFHRLVWTSLNVDYEGPTRFTLTMPNWAELAKATPKFFASILAGITLQIEQIVVFAGRWSLVMAAVVIVIFRGLSSSVVKLPPIRSISLPFWLLIIAISGWSVLWIIGRSPQLEAHFWGAMYRHYGYIPNTVATMALVAAFCEPRWRKNFGNFAAWCTGALVVWLWLTVEIVCLPIVRFEDARIWSEIEDHVARDPNTSVFFVNQWNPPRSPGRNWDGIRGGGKFPELFQSPLLGPSWEMSHAHSLGVRYAAKFATEEGGMIRLSGGVVARFDNLTGAASEDGEMIRLSLGPKNVSMLVAPESVVVVASPGLKPPNWWEPIDRVVVFPTWTAYKASPISKHMMVRTGWDNLLYFDTGNTVAINLGQASRDWSCARWLPDKHWTDPYPDTLDPIANYGLESGADKTYNRVVKAGLNEYTPTYYQTNRHGDFTYRIIFVDTQERLISLDLLELWHRKPGERAIIVELAFDDDPWFSIGTIDLMSTSDQDPAAMPREPVSINVYTPKIRSVRIRLTRAPGAKDIPFLNGIRVRDL